VQSSFVRGIGLFDATMIVAGSMIGSGIFIVSADIARQVGSPGWLLVVWLITGLLTITAALSYGELAALFPNAGGQYVYLREAHGRLWGFLYGWTLFAVIQTGTIAAVAVAFAKFLGVLTPAVSAEKTLFAIGPVSLSTQRLVAIGVVALLTAVNTKGIRTGKIVQNIFTATKVGALALLIVLAFFVGRSENAAIHAPGFWTPVVGGEVLAALALLAALGTAMVGSLFSSDAWNNIGFTAAEVKEPHRTVPRAMMLGTIIVTILYVAANFSYVAVLPFEGIQHAAEDRVGTAAAGTIFGAGAAAIMAIAIMVSTFGCLNGLILAGARVYYAMAQDGLFFKTVGHLNAHGVPARGLVLQGIWAALLTLSGTYGNLLDYVIFAALLFYVLTVAGIFVLRRKRPDVERTYAAPGYPLVPALYIVLASLIMIDLLIYKPAYTWPGLGLVLLGVPIYFLRRGKLSGAQVS
jgi:APA family basic amino acid/polyamine antiporter